MMEDEEEEKQIETTEFMDIPIDLVKSLDNSRLRITNEDISPLMEDIKHRGLLQPIGVIKSEGVFIIRFGNRRLEACRKLGWKTIPAIVEDKKINVNSFMADNVAENVHRVDISPVELSNVVAGYRERGLSLSEICVLLSLSKSRVEHALRISKFAPEEFKEHIQSIRTNTPKKGKIAISVANEILTNRGTTQEQQKELFKLAKSNDLSGGDIRIMNNLMGSGLSFEKSKKNFKNYKILSVELAVDAKEFAKYKLNHKELVKAFIKGTIQANPALLPKA